MQRVTIRPMGKPGEIGLRWRALEAASDGGFFRSWTFLGCLAEERFARAHLLAVTQDGCDVALALLGEGGGRLWLNQTGSPALDAPFIEHNGLLVRRGEPDPTRAVLAETLRSGKPIILSGVSEAVRRAADGAGWLASQQARWAPAIDLASLSGPYLDSLGAGTRSQIRRSQRQYGPELRLSRAERTDQALTWFATLVELHQATWTRRGQPGAFAAADIRRFHEALIARAHPAGEADLLRVEAAGRTVGLLYAFLRDGHVLSYQSGFAYDLAQPREKPGLVAHALAAEHYRVQGARRYDLLAGADRYKLALAREGEMLHWATLHRPWSVKGLAARVRDAAGRMRASNRTKGPSQVTAPPGPNPH